jgi:hypothetical protein
MLNSRAAMVVYVESLRWLVLMAVPKYRPDWAAAAPSVLAALAVEDTTTASRTATAPIERTLAGPNLIL